MYTDDAKIRPSVDASSAIARFEAWLRSHGYDPAHDPFIPDDVELGASASASELVREYLKDQPDARASLRILARHARQLGIVSASVVESCSLAFWE
jgi:hypothetical protein